VQNKALLILLSLINYPVHFERVNEPFSADQANCPPSFEKNNGSNFDKLTALIVCLFVLLSPLSQLHSQLAAVLVSAVNYPPITPANKSLALWALGLFVFLDLFGHPPCVSSLTLSNGC